MRAKTIPLYATCLVNFDAPAAIGKRFWHIAVGDAPPTRRRGIAWADVGTMRARRWYKGRWRSMGKLTLTGVA